MKHYTLPVTYDKYATVYFLQHEIFFIKYSLSMTKVLITTKEVKWMQEKKMFRLISKKNHIGLDKLHWDHRMKAQRQVVKLWQEIE